MTSRLLSVFTLTSANNDLRVSYAGTPVTISIPTGDYVWSCDGTASDFAAALQTAFGSAAGVLSADVVGVDGVTSSAHAEGRPVYSSDDTTEFLFTDALFTLDPRILGWSGDADVNISDDTHVPTYSDYVHRYGWYPQTVPMRDLTSPIVDTAVSFRSDRRRSGVCWTGEDGVDTIDLLYDFIPCAFARTDAAADVDRNTGHYLTVGDPNCAWDRFVIDLSRRVEAYWYYYPDTSATGTRSGPYVWPDRDSLWTNPMARSRVRDPAGEVWSIAAGGIEAIA